MKSLSLALTLSLCLHISSAQALTCNQVLSSSSTPKISKKLMKVQKKAESYAKKKTKTLPFVQIRKNFYKVMTKVLLRKNLGKNRISEEKTKDVYDETVTRVKGLLEKTLITDTQITALNQDNKKIESQLVEDKKAIKLKKLEVESAKEEFARLETHLEEGTHTVVLSQRQKDQIKENIKKRQDELSSLEREFSDLNNSYTEKSGDLKNQKKTLSERRNLRKELSKDLVADIKLHEALPKRIGFLMDSIMVRSLKIDVLSGVDSKFLEEVSIPELNAKGEIIWVVKKYEAVKAREEVSFLKKQIKLGKIKKEIKKLLVDQAHLENRLIIYRDYFLNAQSSDAESFGKHKEFLLKSVLEALNKVENSPGYAALVKYQKNSFIEEFMESFNFIREGQTPKTIIADKLAEQAGALSSEFKENIGAVKNTVKKQVAASIRAAFVSTIVLGSGYGGWTSADLGTTAGGVVASVTSYTGNVINAVEFAADKQFLDYTRTAEDLAKVDPAERKAWLLKFVEDRGLNMLESSDVDSVQNILTKVEVIDSGRAEAEAVEAERIGKVKAAIDGLLEDK
jgi:myosin heavy subunit